MLASVLWDERGIIIIGYLEKGKTINDEYYIVWTKEIKIQSANKNHVSPWKCTSSKNFKKWLSQRTKEPISAL